MSELNPAPEAPAATDAPTPTEPAAAAPEAPKPTEPAKSNPWDNPEAAKAEIERLRRENGAARTNAKQQAADEARTALATEIGKALGLVKDEPADPAKLTEQLTASQSEAKQARVELAVYRNAETAGADPLALLDSATFLKEAANLDPNDTSALVAAMQKAIEANPRLGAAPVNRTPAPNPAQGSSGNGVTEPPQLTKADVERMYAAKDYDGIEKAREEGRLNTVLGIKS